MAADKIQSVKTLARMAQTNWHELASLFLTVSLPHPKFLLLALDYKTIPNGSGAFGCL
jgi:hypothetical protein